MVFSAILQVTTGMWDFMLKYYSLDFTAAQQAQAQQNGFLEHLPSPDDRNNSLEPFYYNNFEVVNVPRFSQDDFKKLNYAIDITNNIYRHR